MWGGKVGGWLGGGLLVWDGGGGGWAWEGGGEMGGGGRVEG